MAEQQSAGALAKERLGKDLELSELQDKLRQLPITTGESVSRTEGDIAEIETRLKDVDRQRGYQLRAPIAGRISALQAWVGKSADPRLPVLSIVPDGGFLEADLLVPARAIGFVAGGQIVHISYDTFPFQQFGFAHGTVRSVSRTLLRPDEIVGPVPVREPSYLVEVALERQTIRAYGAELPLEPDLLLQADIVAERRNLISWLLDPLLSVWIAVKPLGIGARLPEIRQAAASECGLACLAMIASFYGRQTDLGTLRREYPVSLKGVTLAMVMEIATRLGLSGRPFRLTSTICAHCASQRCWIGK